MRSSCNYENGLILIHLHTATHSQSLENRNILMLKDVWKFIHSQTSKGLQNSSSPWREYMFSWNLNSSKRLSHSHYLFKILEKTLELDAVKSGPFTCIGWTVWGWAFETSVATTRITASWYRTYCPNEPAC